MDLSIIIVNYNAKDYLKNCLLSLKKNIDKTLKHEVIVVDNNSNDQSTQMVKKYFPSVKLIENSNEGFSKANNKGVKLSKGKFVLFLNPDTVVYKNTISGMIKFMQQNKDCGAATCFVEHENGRLDYSSHRGFPTPWNSFCYFFGLSKLFPKLKIFSGYTLTYKNLQITHEIDALAGAFMMVNRVAGEQVNWWDEDYFFNGEDLDFCYRLKEKKWKIYFVPEYKILHFGGVSGGTKKHSQHLTTASLETKKTIQKHRFEAMRIFYNKHYRNKYPFFVTKLMMFAISQKEKGELAKLKAL